MAKSKQSNVEELDTPKQDFGNRTKLKLTDLRTLQAKTPNQELFVDLYRRGTDVIFETGSAGTGKSTMALYEALREVLDESNSRTRIIYVKPCVEERRRGYAPGTLEEKDAQFEVSVRNTVNELLKVRSGYEVAKAMGYIEFWTTGLRGMTFTDAVILGDELQNYDYSELKTLIERVGENSRIVVMGDERQEDLSRQHENSGLAKFKRVCENMQGISMGTVSYMPEDNVRSGISRAFCIADYYYKGD